MKAGAQVLALPHVGGDPMAGPATPSLTSMFWNPAALGQVRGWFHAWLDGGSRLTTTGLTRSPIDPATGEPQPTGGAGARTFPSSTATDAAPDWFAAIASDLDTQHLVFALATYDAGYERFHRDASWPGRYHLTDLEASAIHAVAGGVSWRITDDLYVGVAVALPVVRRLDLSLARDTAVDRGSGPFETDAALERVDVRTSSSEIAFHVGALYTFGRLAVGASWQLPPSSGIEGVSSIQTTGDADVSGPAHGGATLHGRAAVTWRGPDTRMLGAYWKLDERWDVAAMAKWIHASPFDRMTIHLSSLEFREPPPGAGPAVPERLTLYRGGRDVVGGQVAAAYRAGEHLRPSAALLVQSAAVAESAVSPAFVDGPRADAMLGLEVYVRDGWTMHAGYAVGAILPRDPPTSDFDPQASVRCVQSGFAVDACREQSEGRALPTAKGRTTQIVQRLGIGLAYDWR